MLSIHDTPAAQEIRCNVKTSTSVVPLILYINVWSDDFEPSAVKNNRKKSLWIKTVTICPPAHMDASNKYKYAIALGWKGYESIFVVARVLEGCRHFPALIT